MTTSLVLGAAVSGRAAAAVLRANGDKVLVYDAVDGAAEGIDADAIHTGAWDPAFLDGVDLIVTSPGIPPDALPLVDAARAGLPVWAEIELAFRHLDAPIGAVTATNGKGTVTEMAAAALTASGLRAAAVGNIGEPLSAAVGSAWDALVVEASSFQLHFVDSFTATAAVLLNVAADHLDWHGSYEGYVAAKQRILERQTDGDIAVFDADDPGATAAISAARAQVVPVSGTRVPAGGYGPDGDVLRIGPASIPIERLNRHDPVFLVDAAAAGAVALHLGADPAALEEALTTYRPAPHRRQWVGEWDGVTWIDDSKATNAHAALNAVRSYQSVVLIAGGLAKGTDPTDVVREPSVRFVVGIGEAGPAMVVAAADGVVADDMEHAVALAAAAAEPGDTVLLAPACASFDMFASYAERGERFQSAVRSGRSS